jgi:type IV pilus assembly protein PilM
VPFWKKELSFSRGAKAPKQAKPPKAGKEAKQPKAPKEKAAPFWKKELSFSRGAEPAAGATLVAAVATEVVDKESKTPFWKLELKRQPKGEKQPKGAKQPRAKKEKSSGGAAKSGLVGLKIGASQVAAARVSNNGSPELLQVARAPLADGIVVGGELRDVDALAATLEELFGKHKLPKRGVRLGIANNRIGVRTFEIVGINDEAQLANAIRFRAQETLPIPLEEAVLDWQVLSERTDENGLTTRRVLLVVAYRELVDQYVLACKMAGIRLSGIDLEAFAMLRALTTPPEAGAADPTAAQVLVNVGHDRSTFAVTDGKHCEFTRVLGWGGHSLTVAIVNALEVDVEQATAIKHQTSLVASAVDAEGVDPATLGTAREAVRGELQAFARELVSSLRFYQNQPGSLGIGEVILTGGTAHLPGFGEELNRLIGVPVRVGDPLNRVAIPKKFRQSDDYSVGSLTVAIGLGIED